MSLNNFDPLQQGPSSSYFNGPHPSPSAVAHGSLHLPPMCFPPPPIPPPVNRNFLPPHIPSELQTTPSNAHDENLMKLISKYPPVQKPQPSRINVSTVAALLCGFKQLMLSVERTVKYLEVTKKTLSEADWSEKCQELEKKKILLSEIDSQLSDPYFIAQVQKTLKRLKSKRNRIKRKNLEWKEKRKDMKEIRQEKNKKIDLWLEKMKDEVERARRAEMVKNEADLVLSDVTLKKIEAKRVLGLLNSLTKLRNAKVVQLSSSTKHAPKEGSESFNLVIDKLKTMWAKQLKEYNLEEQGLKVMLTDAEAERVSSEEKTWRKNLHLWAEALFGERNFYDSLQAIPSNFEHFLSVRQDWDRFIPSEETVMSSNIPIGWVVPVAPSSSDWAKFTNSSKH